MPLSLVCGAECQIVSVGGGAAADSHWSGVTGSPSVVSSPVRSGSYAFQFIYLGLYAIPPTDDIATSGWSSTPLWSKVDDPETPDGTVITGAAS